MSDAIDQRFMQRALYLAKQGFGRVSPNPMVGAVVVYGDQIIGEGYHTHFGGPHAEVHAIDQVKDHSLLSKSTLYVTLEPCAHHGKTPPCASLIVQHQIPKVIVATLDPNPLVGGKGIEFLQQHGVNVQLGMLEEQAKYLNRRFFTFHQKKRPYILLKWAQSLDGYLNTLENEVYKPLQISNAKTQVLSHQWRTQEQAILVGTNTVRTDNPTLTARFYYGRQPLRIILANNLDSIQDSIVLTDTEPTLIVHTQDFQNTSRFSEKKSFQKISSNQSIQEVLQLLYSMHIQSVIIEGGAHVLKQFLDQKLWDEARVVHSTQVQAMQGVKAPEISVPYSTRELIDTDVLYTYFSNA